jgi:integrase
MSNKGQTTTSDFIPWDQFLELIGKLEKDSNRLFTLLFGIGCYTGLRISDLRTMKYENFRNGCYTIKEKKTGKNRVITFNSDLKDIVKRNARKEKGFIFTNEKGGIISVQYLNNMLKTIATNYGIKGNISCHSLRKTFGRRVWENNSKSDAALILLSDLFNHSNTVVTKRYLGITEEEKAQAYINL